MKISVFSNEIVKFNSMIIIFCKVEILTPPEGSKPGDMVEVEGFLRNPDAQLNPKKKIFETCAPGT